MNNQNSAFLLILRPITSLSGGPSTTLYVFAIIYRISESSLYLSLLCSSFRFVVNALTFDYLYLSLNEKLLLA